MYVDVINPTGSEGGGRYSKRECLHNRTAYFVLVTVYFSSLFSFFVLCCIFWGDTNLQSSSSDYWKQVECGCSNKISQCWSIVVIYITTWTFFHLDTSTCSILVYRISHLFWSRHWSIVVSSNFQTVEQHVKRNFQLCLGSTENNMHI